MTAVSTLMLAHVNDETNDVENDKSWAIAHPPPESCTYPAAQAPMHVAGVLPNAVQVLSAQASLQCSDGEGDGDNEIITAFARIEELDDGCILGDVVIDAVSVGDTAIDALLDVKVVVLALD